MSRAVRIDRHGGPEELKIVDVTVGQPGPGEIRIRHKAVGLNYIDVYQRTGLYPFPMPLMLGMDCLLYTSPSPRDTERSRMPSSA